MDTSHFRFEVVTEVRRDLLKILNDEFSILSLSKHRLYQNYDFDKMNSDPTLIYKTMLFLNEDPISFGAVQVKPFFKNNIARVNSRHLVFNKYRSDSLSQSQIGKTKEGVNFGGEIIRHQLQWCKNNGFDGAFVSRDRGPRAFSYFMDDRVNKYITNPKEYLQVDITMKYNVCGDIDSADCWQYIAGVSFNKEPFNQLISHFKRKQA